MNVFLQSAILIGALCLAGGDPAAAQGPVLSETEQLGAAIFFDQSLSINGNQSCASCHDPAAGWTGALSELNTQGAVYEGSIPGRFGNRKPPSSAYATQSPILHPVLDGDDENPLFIGGSFWDGRATGEKFGNAAADQAQGPFLNPVEQALPTPAEVVSRVCAGSYGSLFRSVWGPELCDGSHVAAAYDSIALSIAAFEASPASNAFTSKYDAFLAGTAKLSPMERKGLNLFQGKAKCAKCHVLGVQPGVAASTTGKQPPGDAPLLTDFTFDNIGIPRNPENPFYDEPEFNPAGDGWVDLGLGGFLEHRVDWMRFAPENYAKQKVPTLRNVDKRPYEGFVKAYGHNGYFKSLKSIVHFYNTRDVKPRCVSAFTTEADALLQNCWPVPEVEVNLNDDELGNLHLTDGQEDALVEFMKTLSDGYVP